MAKKTKLESIDVNELVMQSQADLDMNAERADEGDREEYWREMVEYAMDRWKELSGE